MKSDISVDAPEGRWDLSIFKLSLKETNRHSCFSLILPLDPKKSTWYRAIHAVTPNCEKESRPGKWTVEETCNPGYWPCLVFIQVAITIFRASKMHAGTKAFHRGEFPERRVVREESFKREELPQRIVFRKERCQRDEFS